MIRAAPFALAALLQLLPSGSGAHAWRGSGAGGIRGVTVGPIENAYHPGVGYGSAAYERELAELGAIGATWVSLTAFGRVGSLSAMGVDPTFEAPESQNRRDIARAIEQAHAHGFRVMLVTPLWVETGQWRGEIDPKTDEGWARWAASYTRFVRGWAEVAEATHVEMFSAGVELRSWVTTGRAPSFARVIREVRRVYHGLVTYSANWDDADQSVVLGDLDVIGINAFYPLAQKAGAPESEMVAAAQKIRADVHDLAERWQKPVVFTEMGYATRPDPAVRPWEWPENLDRLRVDEHAQAAGYRALLAPLLDEPDFAGFFVWRVYADPDDTSQEPPWAFSPRGKEAELVLRDAFTALWACDPKPRGRWPEAARVPGLY
ncbi:MAG: hypothetical protein FWD17_00750 [Polyangiaceae bacterium]|nr:hypothetical protein [Polyangiaceae bacterium]